MKNSIMNLASLGFEELIDRTIQEQTLVTGVLYLICEEYEVKILYLT